jgi:hypothetical protein
MTSGLLIRFASWSVIAVTLAFPAADRAPVHAQSAAPKPITVPAGTLINVRLTEDVDVDVAHAGMTIAARVDDPVSIGTQIAIPREAKAVVQAVKVAQSGAFKGSDQVSLKLNTVSFGGRVYQVATEYATVKNEGEGKKSARKIGGGAGLGGLIGGIAGGGEGVAIGAVVGGVAGAAVAGSGEQHLKLPAETRLQFKLTNAFRVEP